MLKSDDGDDVEDVEVVFAAEALLVPAHGALQRLHGVAAAILLAGLAIDAERYLPTGARLERVVDGGERAAHQREEVAGLGEGIVPDGEVPVGSGDVARSDRIAVRQEHRRLAPLRFEAGGEDGENVGTVEEIGNAAEALRLALRGVDAVGAVEAHQRAVGRGVHLGDDFQLEGRGGRRLDRQPIGRHVVGFVGKDAGFERQAFEDEAVAVENQRCSGRGALARAYRQDARRRVPLQGRGGCRGRRFRSGSRWGGSLRDE